MGNIYTVGPDEVLVISGGCGGQRKKRYIVGGYGFAWWCVTDVQYLPLHIITLFPTSQDVETVAGVPLTVTGVAQCKIMKEPPDLLQAAAEQFLGQRMNAIKSTILKTLEGHLRAIMGTLTVEEAYKDREKFAYKVRRIAAPDVGKMGIEILSFTIKDVLDDVNYLSSLGKGRTATVKRDANIGIANAERDAGIREAECEKEAMDVVYEMETKIQNHARQYKLYKAQFEEEVSAAKAKADLAYELQANVMAQKIKSEKVQIDVVERRKQVEIEDKEILRKEFELNTTIRLPVEAESFRLQNVAEGDKIQTIRIAEAESEAIRQIGIAEADYKRNVGKAEAELMKAKAEMFKKYQGAAMTSMIVQAMPGITREISGPLSKIEEIVILGGNERLTGELNRLVGQLPPAVTALTGLDMNKMIGKINGKT